jgi:DNA polymerase I
VNDTFKTVAVVDFEYEVAAGGLPTVLCMVAYILDEFLRLVRVIRLWRDDFGSKPPFDIGPDALMVAYSAWAEMTCFLRLNWSFPEYVLDLHTAYLATSNVLEPYDYDETKRKKLGKSLPVACRAYGIEGWERFDKSTVAEDIGAGNWRQWGRETVFAYCEEDVRKTVELLCAMVRGVNRHEPIDVARVLHWSNYSAKAIARIQARGMPIDMYLWNLVQENKEAVVAELIRRFDPSHGTPFPIYSPEGEWSYNRFERWLALAGARAWPRLDSGRLDTSADAFRLMASVVPGAEELHALRDSLGFIVKARLPIGPDGRNRPSLFPFGTATGRNAHAKSPYNAHAGMRSFMKFEPGAIGFYLDWRSQEVAIAAARFNDPVQRAEYESGHVYHALAHMCGLTDDPDPIRWKANNRTQRDRMKRLQLALNYGMGVPSLAKGLDRHPLIAAEIIGLYARKHPAFWQGRLEAVQTAMLRRRIESSYGWPLRISHSPNQRSLLNFPMQSDGAEMLREATVRLCDAGIVPIMLVHDGILFEETDPRKIEEATEIMRAVGREICDGIDVGVDLDWSTERDPRYRDKRPMAQKMWASIMDVLVSIGALPLRDVA